MLVYRFISYLLGPVQHYIRRSKAYKAGLGQTQRQQLQGYAYPNNPAGQVIWVHAASVGESNSALTLIKALLAQQPDLHFVLTSYTATGLSYAQARAPDQVTCTFSPNESTASIKRFLNHFKPQVAFILESDWWPLLLHIAQQFGIPVISLNATISERSFRRMRKIPQIAKLRWQAFCHFYTRDAQTTQRLQQLGIPQTHIETTGCLKFASPPATAQITLGQQFRQKYWPTEQVIIAASTHPGEDELILDTYRALLAKFANLRLILVPRHPHRLPTITTLFNQGLSFILHSEHTQNPEKPLGKAVYIVDQIGVLNTFYGASDVALVCGTWVPDIGGHNMLEPIQAGCITFTGPFYHKQTFMVETLKTMGVLQVTNTLEKTLTHILRDLPTKAHNSAALNLPNPLEAYCKFAMAHIKQSKPLPTF